MTISTEHDAFAKRLARARSGAGLLDAAATVQPRNEDEAFAIQHATLDGALIGGWKIGAKSATERPTGSPLPASGIHRSGATLAREAYWPCGLELEVAFRFGRVFAPQAAGYDDDEVFAAVEQMCATVEIVSSRFAAWPGVDRLTGLADLQNHGALVVGEASPYRVDFPFLSPKMRFLMDDHDIVADTVGGKPANTVGDPRRALPWFVDHCTRHLGIPVTPDMIVTAGSYTGLYLPKRGGSVRAEIEGLAPVTFELV